MKHNPDTEKFDCYKKGTRMCKWIIDDKFEHFIITCEEHRVYYQDSTGCSQCKSITECNRNSKINQILE